MTNKVDTLCEMDRDVMYEFSRRSVERLRNGLRFGIILSLFSDLMDANVDKEVQKDMLVIRSAARAYTSGVYEESMNVVQLFRETTEVDKRFMEKLLRLPPAKLCCECICYESIENIREKRIQLLISTVYEILSRWLDSITFAEAVRRAYSQRDFGEMLKKMLHLYSLETRELSNSFKLRLAKELLTNRIFNTMECVTDGVAQEFARRIFLEG